MTIELVTTDGIFALDGGEWEVTNNIWIVGDDREVLVFDAAHDHQPIVEAVNGRKVAGIVLTHGHNDHINAAAALADAVAALGGGKRQFLLFEGAPGMGKTTLLDALQRGIVRLLHLLHCPRLQLRGPIAIDQLQIRPNAASLRSIWNRHYIVSLLCVERLHRRSQCLINP